MTPKKTQANKPQPGRKQKDSVFKDAWSNMTEDFERFLPETLRNKNKKPFVLWLFIVELLVLGVIGKFAYDWLFK